MKTTQERLDNLLAAIAGGDGDDDIDMVYGAVKDRHKVLKQEHSAIVKRDLKVGDIVSIEREVFPKYLWGLQAQIVDIFPDSACVRIIAEDRHKAGRFARDEHQTFQCPYYALEKVS